MGDTLEQGKDVCVEQLAPYTNQVQQLLGQRLKAGERFLQVLKTPVIDLVLAIG